LRTKLTKNLYLFLTLIFNAQSIANADVFDICQKVID